MKKDCPVPVARLPGRISIAFMTGRFLIGMLLYAASALRSAQAQVPTPPIPPTPAIPPEQIEIPRPGSVTGSNPPGDPSVPGNALPDSGSGKAKDPGVLPGMPGQPTPRGAPELTPGIFH